MSDNNEKQNNGLKIENEKTDTEDIRQQNEGDTVSEKKTVRLFGHKITRKKIYTACAGAVCAALLVGSYAMVNSDSVTPDTDSAAKVTEIQTKVKTDKKEEKVQVTDSDADTKESVKKTETAQETVKKKREETESQEKVASNNKSNTNSSVSENANKSDKGTNSVSGGRKENVSSNSSAISFSGSGSGNVTKQDSTPLHQHNYNIPIIKIVHHDAVYSTVHHDAVYNTIYHDAVYQERSICNQCGADITGNEAVHFETSLLSGGNCGSCHGEYVTVSNAWNEQVLVSDAWDEQVLVSAAWDETVTTGYKYSCGAMK